MTFSFLSTGTLSVLSLSILTLLTTAQPSHAATVASNNTSVQYSLNFGNDVIDVECTCTYTTPGLSGHWVLTEVASGTYPNGTPRQSTQVIASQNYPSGVKISTLELPNGSLYAAQSVGSGPHFSYHYELLNEVWDTATQTVIVTADLVTPEHTVI